MKRAALTLLLAAACAAQAGDRLQRGARDAREREGEVHEWKRADAEVRARSSSRARRHDLYFRHARRQDRPIRSATKAFREWDLPAGAHPHAVLVDKQGMCSTPAMATGTIGKLDPATGKVVEYRAPFRRRPPYAHPGARWNHLVHCFARPNRANSTRERTITEYKTLGGPVWPRARERRGGVVSASSPETPGPSRSLERAHHRGRGCGPAAGRGASPRRRNGSILWFAFYGSNEL